jgi:Skp family chaperone for outer membrane proteins
MRTLLWVSGVVVAVAAFVGAGSLWAENDAKKPESPRTRIGLFNLSYVVKNYHKYKTFQEDMKGFIEPYQRKDVLLRKKLDKLRAEAEALAKQSSDGEQPAKQLQQKKEALEENAKQLQRELEDNLSETKRKVGERSDDQMKMIYIDVYEAVRRYAKNHDLDAVLHYNDALSREEYYSVKNIAAKINSGGLMVATSTPGLDISKDIADLLNYGPRKKQ